MILTVSNNADFCKSIYRFLLQRGKFSRFMNFEDLDNFVGFDTISADFVLIDGNSSQRHLRRACEIIESHFPSVEIKILTGTDTLKDIKSPIYSGSENLKISLCDTTACLLGYPLRLTKNEHNILLLLLSDRKRIFSSEEILCLIFPFSSKTSKNQLAVHVCNINKKAMAISGRRLIVNPHKNGYTLNSRI